MQGAPRFAQVRERACELLKGCWVDNLDDDVARLLGMRGAASIPVRRCCRLCTATAGSAPPPVASSQFSFPSEP